ncbi:MAG: FAD-binding oxidoreductase, partial [Gammaproteobacteria bacterium]
AAAIELQSRARIALGDQLNAFELISRTAVDFVLAHIPGVREPLAGRHEWYVLLELGSPREDANSSMEGFLAAEMDAGRVTDGVLASSSSQRDELWRLRHSISEAQKNAGAGIKHDISVPVSRIADFLDEARTTVTRLVPGVHIVAFGHLGDGNLHFNLNQPDAMSADEFLDRWEPVSREVHSIAAELGGSFSAEHGIGTLKTGELERLRGGVEIDLMRSVKAALDPHGIMNPGKVLSAS